jgi:hypothetical protein
MAEIFYPTKYKATGPWLIDSAQLLSLDDAIDQYSSKSLATGASSEGQTVSVGDGTIRTITFQLRHGKELQTSSFREAIVHPGASSEIALGLKYEVKLRGTTARLTLGKEIERTGTMFGSSDEEQVQLNIDVEPRTSALSQELFVVMKDWAIDSQHSLWQKVIFKLKGAAGFTAVIWGLIFLAGLLFPSGPNPKEQYKEEARKLLAQGINSGNQQKAIELLLAIQADYSPPVAPSSPTVQRSPKWIVENSIALFWLTAMALFPALSLGIWKGKQRLHLWRSWLPFVFVTIPGLIVTRYLEPQAFGALERVLGLK